jgi:predicted metal-dependent hydrolase
MNNIKIDKLLRTKRRTIGLEVTSDARLVVRAPLRVSLKEIERIILEKTDWILRKKSIAQKRQLEVCPKRFVDGERFYYLGKPYRLKLTNADDINLNERLELPKKFLSNAKKHLIKWYKASAYEEISRRVEHYTKIMGVSYSKVKISSARKRFGSCSAKGNLNFSWMIVMAPLEVIDYVVVHELVHLTVKNHSGKFWNRVKAVCPDYKQRRKWLKDNAHFMRIE